MQGGQLNQLGNLLQGLQGLFSKAAGTPASAVSQQPLPFSEGNISINITLNPLGALQQPAGGGPLQSFSKVPEVGGDSQWKGFADAANSRITGSDANRKAHLFDGTNPWSKGGDKSDMAAVGWALQKNDNLRFDADSKQFYVTNADGSTKNVASLDEVKGQIAKAGGANPNNGAAYNAVGAFLDGRAGSPQSNGAAQKASGFENPFQQLVQMLEKLVQLLTGQGGAAGSGGGIGAATGGGGGIGAPAGSGGGIGAPIGGGSGVGSASGGSSAGSSGGVSGGGSGSGGISGTDSMVSKAGASIDKMMAEAEQLMASDKPSDQLKGQMLMQRAMRMFETISKMLEQRSQAQAKAIQAIK
jgi:hypothetical protein